MSPKLINTIVKHHGVIDCRDCGVVMNTDSHPHINWKFNLQKGTIDAVCDACEVINEHYRLHEQMEQSLHEERNRIPHCEYAGDYLKENN